MSAWETDGNKITIFIPEVKEYPGWVLEHGVTPTSSPLLKFTPTYSPLLWVSVEGLVCRNQRFCIWKSVVALLIGALTDSFLLALPTSDPPKPGAYTGAESLGAFRPPFSKKINEHLLFTEMLLSTLNCARPVESVWNSTFFCSIKYLERYQRDPMGRKFQLSPRTNAEKATLPCRNLNIWRILFFFMLVWRRSLDFPWGEMKSQAAGYPISQNGDPSSVLLCHPPLLLLLSKCLRI